MVSRRLSGEAGHRRKFLAIVDATPECERAIAYAARRARSTGGAVVLLYVIETADFQQWLGVEQIMREEASAAAAATLDSHASRVREKVGIEPELVVREGEPVAEILAQIREDPEIGVLVLGAGVDKAGPGPLVTQLTRTSGSLPVPITIVPGELSRERLEAVT